MKVGVFAVLDNQPAWGRPQQRVIAEVLEQAAMADRLGFDDFWVAEHHFDPYGICPSPAVLLAALAQRTERMRLGVAVSVLPFHHPVRVAEDYALVDVLSGGRLQFGVGAGYLAVEFRGFGVDPGEKRTRLDAALQAVLRAWSGEPPGEGPYWSGGSQPLNILPLQRPHPPVWLAMTRPEALPHLAARGWPPLWIAYVRSHSLQDVAATVRSAREAYAAAGSDAIRRHGFPVAFHVHVANTDGEAEDRCREPLRRYLAAQRIEGNRYDGGFADELAIVGSPATVARRLRELAALGVDHVLCLLNFGGMAHADVCDAIEHLGRRVLPVLRGEGPADVWTPAGVRSG